MQEKQTAWIQRKLKICSQQGALQGCGSYRSASMQTSGSVPILLHHTVLIYCLRHYWERDLKYFPDPMLHTLPLIGVIYFFFLSWNHSFHFLFALQICFTLVTEVCHPVLTHFKQNGAYEETKGSEAEPERRWELWRIDQKLLFGLSAAVYNVLRNMTNIFYLTPTIKLTGFCCLVLFCFLIESTKNISLKHMYSIDWFSWKRKRDETLYIILNCLMLFQFET